MLGQIQRVVGYLVDVVGVAAGPWRKMTRKKMVYPLVTYLVLQYILTSKILGEAAWYH